MRIVFDRNVPVGVRRFYPNIRCTPSARCRGTHSLKAATSSEAAGFDVLVTADQNITYHQNLTGRKLALIVLGSNLWPIVRNHAESIAAAADAITTGGYHFIEMPLPDR